MEKKLQKDYSLNVQRYLQERDFDTPIKPLGEDLEEAVEEKSKNKSLDKIETEKDKENIPGIKQKKDKLNITEFNILQKSSKNLIESVQNIKQQEIENFLKSEHFLEYPEEHDFHAQPEQHFQNNYENPTQNNFKISNR